MNYIGIDPGHSGGVAVIDETGKIIWLMIYSDYDLRKVAETYSDAAYVVEHVGAMPGQGVTSMFNFGKSFGYILGVLEANKCRYELVRPQKWKAEFGATSNKNTSIAVAQRLFPKANLFRTERCTKKHDGMAEALLMAEYARRHMK